MIVGHSSADGLPLRHGSFDAQTFHLPSVSRFNGPLPPPDAERGALVRHPTDDLDNEPADRHNIFRRRLDAEHPREIVERLTPLLATMGKKVVYCGEAGQGSMMKMAINLLLGTMMEAFAEMLSFGSMGGLTTDAMLDVIFSGPLNCGLFQMKAPLIVEQDFPPSFPLKHMTKDFKFVVDTAYDLGAPVPAAHTMLQLFRLAVGKQYGDLDFAAIWKLLEQLGKPLT